MGHEIRTEDLEGRPIAAIRLRAAQKDLSTVVPRACGEVWSFLKSAKVENLGRHVAVYFDGEINLEVGVEVDGPFASDGRVIASSTPAGTVAATTHVGPYSRLHEAHEAVLRWCSDHGRSLAGPSWEIYGHWDDDPSKVRTDVYYLLA